MLFIILSRLIITSVINATANLFHANYCRRDSFITHRAFCDALAQESARTPPTLSAIGTHLYHNSNMSLGLSQVNPQISSNHQQPSASILQLGNSRSTPQFPNLTGQPINSPYRTTQTLNPSPFFIPDTNQTYHHEENQLLPNKQYDGLLQFPEIDQNNPNHPSPNPFNLGFVLNNSNTASSIGNSNNNDHNNNSSNLSSPSMLLQSQFNNGHESNDNENPNLFADHITSNAPSLYSTSIQSHHNAASHMSATALLQKAAQLGSTSSNRSTSLLRSFGSSSSGSAKSDGPLITGNFASFFGENNVNNNNNNNNNNFHDLMNSLACGSSSIFGNTYGGNENENNFGGYNGKKKTLEQLPPQNHRTLSFGGSDGLTRDFLGVGEIVRSMSSTGGMEMSMKSLDSERKAAPKKQAFGGGDFQ